MSRPQQILQLEWTDVRGDQERRYRKPLRCADQLASILAAPDDVARLKGLWRTSGWDADRITWEPVDVGAFLEDCATAVDVSDPDGISFMERMELTVQVWRQYNEQRVEGT